MARDGWRKLRSILSLGGIGAVITGGIGGVWSLLSGLLTGYLVPELVLTNTVLWAMFGGFAATGFAATLAAVRSRGSLQEIGLGWAAIVGGLAGAVAPLALNWAIGGFSVVRILVADLPLLGFFAAMGAGLTAGLVVIAQGAPRSRLEKPVDEPGLIEADR